MKNNSQNTAKKPELVLARAEEVEPCQDIENSPHSVDSCLRAVKILLEQGEVSQAFEALDRGTWECLDQGRFSSAVILMEKMLKIRPEHVQTHIEIGKTHLQVGRFQGAVECFARAFDGFLAQGALVECESALHLMVRVDPGNILVKVKKAEFLAQKGRASEALALFRICASILENNGQYQDYLQVGERMLELDPGLDDIRIKVGETLIAEANAFVNYRLFDKAIQALCRAIKYQPNQVDTHVTLARVLVSAGRRADAVDMALHSAREIAGQAHKRELLLLAQELTGQPGQIAELSRELGVDLFTGQENTEWPFPDEEEEGLGNQATSPLHGESEHSPEDTHEKGSTIGDTSLAKNLITLLRLVTQFPAPGGRVTLVEQGKTEPLAEVLIGGQRVLWGVRVRGELFVDEALRREQPELAASLLTRAEADWQRFLGKSAETGTEESPPMLMGKDKDSSARTTAAALVEIARIATMRPLGTLVDMAEPMASPAASYSALAMMMEAGRLICAPGKEWAELKEQARNMGDEWWLMARPAKDEEFLPLYCSGSISSDFEETIAAAILAADLAAQAEAIQGPENERGVGVCYVLADGAWGGLVVGGGVLVVRCPKMGFGVMLRRLRACATGGTL